MDRTEWDRLSPSKRDNLILTLIYGDHVPLNVSSDRDLCASYVETEIAHRNLRCEYVRELARLLIGFEDIHIDDAWSLITATPGERCLAAYNVLETTVPKED